MNTNQSKLLGSQLALLELGCTPKEEKSPSVPGVPVAPEDPHTALEICILVPDEGSILLQVPFTSFLPSSMTRLCFVLPQSYNFVKPMC